MTATTTTLPATRTFNRLAFLLLIIAYIAFINLGMSDTLRDVAFPFILGTFLKTKDITWIFLLAGTIGYMLASFFSGQVVARIGVGRALALSCALRAVGLIGFALAPSWETLLLAGFITGLGGGTVDSGLNILVAANYGTTAMFWLHAAFGIGATLGPLLMTSLLANSATNALINGVFGNTLYPFASIGLLNRVDQVWRSGYGLAGGLQIALMIVFLLTLSYWQVRRKTTASGAAGAAADVAVGAEGVMSEAVAADSAASKPHAPLLSTLRLPDVWLSILIFILYTGTEVAAPLWANALFTQARGIPTEVAGVWVSIYWATFTVGRIAAGFITQWLNEILYLRLSMVLAVIGAVLLWWSPVPEAGAAGLAIIGYALAPLFPALISNTEKRVSDVHAANTIGFQIAAAGMGVAIVPGIAGVLAQRLSLEVVPVMLIIVCAAMLVLHEFILYRARISSHRNTVQG